MATTSIPLIEPQDVSVFPHAKSASPSGNEYIGRIEVIDVAGGTNLEYVTHGEQTVIIVVAAGDVIEGPITSITTNTNVTRVRIWYLSQVQI